MAVSTILYIILIGIIALITAIFFYFYKPERSRNLRYILSSLRFLSIFTILLLLLNPEIKQTQLIKSPVTNIETEQTVSSYSTGMGISLGLNYKF